nr:aconitate hydratase AcnA [Silvimonas soli]
MQADGLTNNGGSLPNPPLGFWRASAKMMSSHCNLARTSIRQCGRTHTRASACRHPKEFMMSHDLYHSLKTLKTADGRQLQYYSLPALESAGIGRISRLPVSIRIVLESVLRNCDGKKVTDAHIKQLANWGANASRTDEIPFVVARVVLQDFTGVPLLADLAAMRNVADKLGKNPKVIEPLVPVDLVVDHSVQVDYYGTPDALRKNMEMEFKRNTERYQFMKWGMQAFDTFKVVPPGVGIVHQVNLEYLFRGVQVRDGVAFPDTLVGTDSHTTMINGVGVVGWGVGGIEAEAGMLGQPVYFLTPDVIGVELSGKLHEGITATDLVLTVTELLRKEKVVGKFVEFFGEGAASLSVVDRATIGNMAPEYGATMGFFPVDEKTVAYLKGTGRQDDEIAAFEAYFKAQGLFGVPNAGEIDYTRVVKLDLCSIVPSLAGPKRPQDRIPLPDMRKNFEALFVAPAAENGFAKTAADLARRVVVSFVASSPTTEILQAEHGAALNKAEMVDNRPTPDQVSPGHANASLGNGDILIAAITSCTNTSNPGVLLAAGLLAKKAVEKGLSVSPHIKTSLAPGSRVVTEYLTKTGLLEPLAQLGFALAGYGCTTCIGNAGDLAPEFNEAITKNDLIAAAVLSGNRNFEARIHPNIRANYLASPPLVVAFAIAGRANIDLTQEPLGNDRHGQPVFLKDIWPASEEISALLKYAMDPDTFRRLYSDLTKDLDLWNAIPAPVGQVYSWPDSTYIAKPPFFDDFSMKPGSIGEIKGAKALLIMGDSVTTDHISPAGSFGEKTPAGQYLLAHNVQRPNFNSYGSRRGNHDVMIRGTFANVRVKNLMLPAKADGTRIEGGFTLLDGQQTTVYDAAQVYIQRGIPTIVFAGEEYGTGSSRDWAAKGTALLGAKAVVARSFERIHRSNLVGMGVLPLQFKGSDSAVSLGLKGDETFDVLGVDENLKPQQDLTLVITRTDGSKQNVTVLCRIDTPIEVDYFKHGGILPFVLRGLLQ